MKKKKTVKKVVKKKQPAKKRVVKKKVAKRLPLLEAMREIFKTLLGMTPKRKRKTKPTGRPLAGARF